MQKINFSTLRLNTFYSSNHTVNKAFIRYLLYLQHWGSPWKQTIHFDGIYNSLGEWYTAIGMNVTKRDT